MNYVFSCKAHIGIGMPSLSPEQIVIETQKTVFDIVLARANKLDSIGIDISEETLPVVTNSTGWQISAMLPVSI